MNKADITPDLVARLVASQCPEWAELPISRVALDGWDNTTFRLGTTMSVRLPSGDSYVAQIDCGDGPREVGSSDDLWAPLVDLQTGTKYRPIAWKVSGEGFTVDETNGKPTKHSETCAYDDGVATGTVTLKKA